MVFLTGLLELAPSFPLRGIIQFRIENAPVVESGVMHQGAYIPQKFARTSPTLAVFSGILLMARGKSGCGQRITV